LAPQKNQKNLQKATKIPDKTCKKPQKNQKETIVVTPRNQNLQKNLGKFIAYVIKVTE
jgi:hypothetical protein